MEFRIQLGDVGERDGQVGVYVPLQNRDRVVHHQAGREVVGGKVKVDIRGERSAEFIEDLRGAGAEMIAGGALENLRKQDLVLLSFLSRPVQACGVRGIWGQS